MPKVLTSKKEGQDKPAKQQQVHVNPKMFSPTLFRTDAKLQKVVVKAAAQKLLEAHGMGQADPEDDSGDDDTTLTLSQDESYTAESSSVSNEEEQN